MKREHFHFQSSDYKKIYSVIIDSYHTTTVVKPVAEDAFMLQAARVINIYNTMNKSYSNAHVFLLLPLQGGLQCCSLTNSFKTAECYDRSAVALVPPFAGSNTS